jgi:hypothetical protein
MTSGMRDERPVDKYLELECYNNLGMQNFEKYSQIGMLSQNSNEVMNDHTVLSIMTIGELKAT